MAQNSNPKPKQVHVDPATLMLDIDNPRLAQQTGNKGERDVIQYLADECDLAEIVQSILANGYYDFEPLILLRETIKKKEVVIVIEGNRRVAAIKVIQDQKLARDVGIAVGEIPEPVLASLKKASAIFVESRDAARKYIGFKHINGPHKWDSFAKARFAKDWYEAEKEQGITLQDIARRLGDRHDTVQRLVMGMIVIDQAQDNNIFLVEDRFNQGRPFAFSHLYTALTRSQYREYLGLSENWRTTAPAASRVPKGNLPKLKKVMRWLYGSSDEQVAPVVQSQNPHVKQLAEVLGNPAALKKLEANNSLADAYQELDPRAKKFMHSLLAAMDNATDAQKYLDGYDGDKALREYGERLMKVSRNIHSVMEATLVSKVDP